MGFSERLGGFYSAIEEKFFSAMDFLDEKGVPAYSVIDPLEERGVPVLPVFSAAAIAIVLMAYALLFLNNAEVTMSLSITDSEGNPLTGVSITATDSGSGKPVDLGSTVFQDKQSATLRLGIGAKILIDATKEGYRPFSGTVYFDAREKSAVIRLAKLLKPIEGKLRLVDSDTGDPVTVAQVTAEFAGRGKIDCIADDNGTYTCPQAIEGEAASITVIHGNYEQRELTASFTEGNDNEVKLVPKASAATGTSNLIVRVFDADTRAPAGNYNLKIYDARDSDLITDVNETDDDGQHVEKISKGTSIRIVVHKEAYLAYDSSAAGESVTLRSDEERKDVYLRPGKNVLTAGVIDATGRPLPSIPVLLFNAKGEIIGQKDSSLAGQAEFSGLDAEAEYYVSAWQDGFIPSRQLVDLSSRNSLNLVMQRATAANSGTLTIYAVDTKSTALSDVSLNFYEDANGQALAPLGIPVQKTDITGKYSLLAPLHSTIVVKASKGTLEGEQSIRILDTFRNEAMVTMREPFSDVKLKITGEDGKEESGGFISLIAGSSILLESEYAQGGVSFNPKGNNYVRLEYTTPEGKAYSEEVYVKDQNEVSVSLSGKTAQGTNSALEFLGIYTVDGEKADGISKGMDYFLKFRAAFPEGQNRSGLHVRLGSDATGFADSEDAGITGFSASGAGAFYGRSYSPQPLPGFEALDFENSGAEGQYNKWIELYFQRGGEKTVKIRVKAKETAKAGEIELHYRAWTVIGDRYYRSPKDEELGLEPYSETRTGLYAQATKGTIRILGPSASCANEFCASYKFAGSDGSEFAPEKFKAALGSLYALDITLSPKEAGNVTVKASTSKVKPKVSFQGFAVNNPSDFQDTNSQDTSIEVDNVPAPSTGPTNIRLFFKANAVENSNIGLQIVSGDKVLNQQFHFNVYMEKKLTLTTLPDAITFGKDFTIVLQDEEFNPVEYAQVRLSKPSGENLLTMKGNASPRSGAKGRYPVKNTFSSGTISYEATADGFSAMSGTLEISKQGIIKWGSESASMLIRKGAQSSEAQLDLVNGTKQSIQGLAFEVKPIGSLPEGMTIKLEPLTTLLPEATRRVRITAEYTGTQDSAHGEASVTVRGRADSGYLVSAQARLNVDYNPKISPDCLEFSKDRMALYLASGAEDQGYFQQQYANYYRPSASSAQVPAGGQSTGLVPDNPAQNTYLPSNYYQYAGFSSVSKDTFTAKLAQRQECQAPLQLKASAAPADGQQGTGIDITSSDITLTPTGQGARDGSAQVVTVNAKSSLLRNYPSTQKFSFTLSYGMDGFSKSMPIDVYIWNPRYALDVSRNIELFLGPNDRGVYSAQVPLFVRNVGQADIENVQFRVSSATSGGNVDVKVTPPIPIQLLRRGDSIYPPQTLVAQATRNEKTTLLDVKQLDITGVIDGTTYSFGPVTVTSHVSSANCLTAIPGNVSFISTKAEGALSQELTLRNTCAEEVRVVDISRPPLGNNRLAIVPQGGMLPPGSEARFTLVLTKGGNYSGPQFPMYVQAFLPRSGTPIQSSPIILDVRIGPYVGKGSSAAQEMTMPVCEGGTKQVRLPVIASGATPLCDTAYCDAQQLSSYLVDRAEEKIKDAEKQMQTLNYLLSNVNCRQEEIARGYCSFDSLGVKGGSFTVYMSHDNISQAIMQKAIDGKNGTIRSFRPDFFTGKSAGEYLGGYSKQLYMNSNFRGCGQYLVRLNGSVTVQGNRLLPELMNVVIDITPDEASGSTRTITEQCLPNIQNMSNFLPRDDGLTMTKRYDTWPGVVTPKDRGLDDLAAELAKGFFGSDQRSVKSDATSTNTLRLDIGNPEGYTVKLQMDKALSDNPVTINAFIREPQTEDKALQKEIITEASQAIRNVRDGTPEGCIGADESYILLKGKANAGNLQIKVNGNVPVQFDAVACTDLNVSSKLRETVNISARKYTEFDGLAANPFFKAEKKAETDTFEKLPDATTVKLERLNPKTNLYDGTALLCTKGNGQFQQANGKQIIVEASRQEGDSRKPANMKAELAVCGIHPLTFLAKTADSSKMPPTKAGEFYYATFIWKGAPEELTFAEMERMVKVDDEFRKAELALKGEAPVKDPRVEAAKKKAAYSYLAGCAGTSLLTSALRPTVATAFPAYLMTASFILAADCFVPFGALMWGDSALVKGAGSLIHSVLSVFGPVKEAIGGVLGWMGSGLNSMFSPIARAIGIGGASTAQQGLGTLASSPETINTNIIDAFVPADALKDIILGGAKTLNSQVSSGGYRTRIILPKSSLVASNVASEISNAVTESYFNGTKNDFTKELEEKLAKNIRESLQEAITEKGPVRGAVLKEEEVQKAVQKAIEKTGKDSSIWDKLYNAKSSLSGELKTGNIAEAAADSIVKDAAVNADAYGTKRFDQAVIAGATDFADDTTIRGNAAFSSIENSIRNDAKSKLASQLGLTGPAPTYGLPTDVASSIDSTQLAYKSDEIYRKSSTLIAGGGATVDEVPAKTKVTIEKDDIDSMIKEINAKVREKVRSVAGSGAPWTPPAAGAPATFEDKVKEKFAKEGYKKLGVSTTEEALKKAAPKLTSWKSWLLFAKNAVKEGAFGILSNAVGMALYDKVLQSEYSNITSSQTSGLTREQQLAAAGAITVTTNYKSEGCSEPTKPNTILKYRTYRVTVDRSGGIQTLNICLAKEIPLNVKKDPFVLNSCGDDSYFREGTGAALPGLVPSVDRYPAYFDSREPGEAAKLKKIYIAAVANYFRPQKEGERIGTQIAAAAKEYKAQMPAGVNIEALMAAIGMVESGLGTDTSARFGQSYMFGCDIREPSTVDPYGNARCAARMFVKYSQAPNNCGTNVACYYTNYTSDPKNQAGGYITNLRPEHFTEIYNSWNVTNYAINAPGPPTARAGP